MTSLRRAGVLIVAAAYVVGQLQAGVPPQPRQRAAAESASRAPRAMPALDSTGAAITFRGDTLFVLHGALGPFDAAQRAGAASAKLAALVNGGRATSEAIVVVPRAGFSELLRGGDVLMTVVDADAASLGKPRDVVARELAANIERVLAAARGQLSARALALDVGYAALATLLLVLALWLLRVAFPRLHQRLDALRRARIRALRIQQLELLSPDRLARILLVVARSLRVAITIVLFYLYVPLVLSFFPWTEPLSRRIVGYALTPLGSAWSSFLGFVPNVFYLLVIALITRYALKLVHSIFRAIESGAVTVAGFYREWAEPTYKIARVLVLAFAAVVGFPYLPGAHTDAFKGISIFFGVLFSLGSSSAIGNVVAGIVLTYTRAFEVGDRVKIGEAIGDVTERTLLVTRLRTIKNVEVTIPNGTVLAAHVLNYTRLAGARGLILHTTVTIGYDAAWRTVHALLMDAASRTEHVLSDPAPFVLQTSLDDFFVSYELNAYTARADLMASMYSALHANIQDAFNEAGVEIMSPHFSALRDGNAIAIPETDRPRGYTPPRFGVDARTARD